MGFNTMFSSLAGEGENSDRIFTKNGVKTKFMSGKQPIVFTILPALDPANPDKATSYLPSILPDNSLSAWGNGASVYRGLGHGDWKERCSVVSLSSVGEQCPIDELFRAAKRDPEWEYLTKDEGEFGSPNRVTAAIPMKRMMLFCNVYLPNDVSRTAHVGIFSKTLANKLVGENGIVFAPSMATEQEIAANYLAAYANGDITSPQASPNLIVEKGHDKGDMSGYDIKFAIDASRRVVRTPITQDIMATRYNIADVREYLNVLTAEQIVQLLVRELSGRSPAGFHEHAFLKLVLGSRYNIPEPPSAPGALNTVQSGFAAAAPQPTPAPTVQQSVPTPHVQQAPQPQAPVAQTTPQAPRTSEADAALAAAVKAGAVPPTSPQQPHVVGDPVPGFDKAAFLARIAGGNK